VRHLRRRPPQHARPTLQQPMPRREVANDLEVSAMTEPTSPAPRVLLTVEEAADRLSIGRTTMYALIKAGHIATVRVGYLRRVPAAALTDYVQRLAEQRF